MFSFEDMRSKDLQNRVLLKYKDRQSSTKIHEDLHGSVDLSTIEKRWKMIRNTSRITLLKSTGHRRTVRAEANIWEIKHRHDYLRMFLCCTIARALRISRTSI